MLWVFDHELAFSFIKDIGQQSAPWILANETYLNYHLFFRQLKGKDLDLAHFTKSLAALPDLALPSIMAEVPPEWNNGSETKLEHHIRAVAERAPDFAEEIRKSLS